MNKPAHTFKAIYSLKDVYSPLKDLEMKTKTDFCQLDIIISDKLLLLSCFHNLWMYKHVNDYNSLIWRIIHSFSITNLWGLGNKSSTSTGCYAGQVAGEGGTLWVPIPDDPDWLLDESFKTLLKMFKSGEPVLGKKYKFEALISLFCQLVYFYLICQMSVPLSFQIVNICLSY